MHEKIHSQIELKGKKEKNTYLNIIKIKIMY